MNQYAGTLLGTLFPTTNGGDGAMTAADWTEHFGYAKITSFNVPGPAQTILLGDVNWDDQVRCSFGVSVDLVE